MGVPFFQTVTDILYATVDITGKWSNVVINTQIHLSLPSTSLLQARLSIQWRCASQIGSCLTDVFSTLAKLWELNDNPRNEMMQEIFVAVCIAGMLAD